MILIEMEIPKSCYVCPCSYTIRTGPYEGEEVCSILNHQGKPVEESWINVYARPVHCPMREVVPLGYVDLAEDKD